MPRKLIPAVFSCLFLSCCALFPQQDDVDLTDIPGESAPKTPSLKVKIDTDYRFDSFRKIKTGGVNSFSRRENAQTSKSASYLKERDFIGKTVSETLFDKASDRTKGELNVKYVIKTNARCSFGLTFASLATLYVAPLIGFPSDKACGTIQMTADVKDARGDLVKSYFVTKNRYLYLGPWYGKTFPTGDDPLRAPLLKEALIETTRQISNDAETLTKRLDAVFAEKHPQKKAKAPKKRVFTDYY